LIIRTDNHNDYFLHNLIEKPLSTTIFILCIIFIIMIMLITYDLSLSASEHYYDCVHPCHSLNHSV